MVTIASTTKRTSPYDAMTIKALQQRQLDLARQTAETAAPREIASPWQGVAQLAQSAFSGIREQQAATAEGDKRQQLAQLLAGVDPTKGATPEQIGQLGALDPEQAKWQADRGATISDNLQKHGWDVQAAEAEAKRLLEQKRQEQDFQISQQHDQQRATAGLQEDTQQEARDTAAAKAKADADAAALKATADVTKARRRTLTPDEAAAGGFAPGSVVEVDEFGNKEVVQDPSKVGQAESGVGKIMSDYNKKVYGEPGTPDAIRLRDIALAKETALSKGQRIQIDKDGNITFEQGGQGDGAVGSGQDIKNQANLLDDYRKAAASGTSLITTIDMLDSARGKAGVTGPLGKVAGFVGDLLESTVGTEHTPGMLGSSGARAMLNSGGLKFIQDEVAKSKGSISNMEEQMFALASPGLQQTDAGNEALLKIARIVAKRSQERVQAAEAYASTHGGKLDGFEPIWQQYTEANPTFVRDDNSPTGIRFTDEPAAPPAGGGAVVTPQTQAEFDALPKGAKYIDPDDPTKTVQTKN